MSPKNAKKQPNSSKNEQFSTKNTKNQPKTPSKAQVLSGASCPEFVEGSEVEWISKINYNSKTCASYRFAE